MKQSSQEFLHSRILAGLIYYAAALFMLNCWYDSEHQKLQLELKKSDLVCVMQHRDPKIHAARLRKANIEIANRQKSILGNQAKLIELSSYFWLIAIIAAVSIVLLQKLFDSFQARSFVIISVTIAVILILSGIFAGLVKQTL